MKRRFSSITKRILFNMGSVIIIVGLISSFIIASILGRTSTGSLFEPYERNWGLTIGIFLAIFLSSLFMGIILIAFSEVLEALEIITSNTGEIPNITNTPNINNNSLTNKWKCPQCGKIHQNYETSCVCGCEKP